jgi:hypothetical protein
MLIFQALVALASLLAGGIAAIAGFGIGSLLTPLLGWHYGLKTAVVAVSIPHLLATAYRFWLMRAHLDRDVLKGFGVASAAGGLAGAVLHGFFQSRWLTYLLAALLVFVGTAGLTGLSRKLRFEGPWAWAAGILSGVLGGLVGNQGGIRSGAMLGLDVEKSAFVATATAIGLFVDFARMPVYLFTSWGTLGPLWPSIAIASLGVLAGTLLGGRLLRHIPERLFRRLVSLLVLALGIALFVHPA